MLVQWVSFPVLSIELLYQSSIIVDRIGIFFNGEMLIMIRERPLAMVDLPLTSAGQSVSHLFQGYFHLL